MTRIQYTVRGVPQDLDAELRREARTTGKTLNALVLETLEHAKLRPSPVIHDDLEWFLGSNSGEDRGFDSAQDWLQALPSELA
jgi:hypothetical protein